MTQWHVPPWMMDGYLAGEADPASAASTEAHLLACAVCRSRLDTATDAARLDRLWAEVVEAVDAPRVSRGEWLLSRLGVSESTARLVAVTPILQWSSIASAAVALGFAVLAAQASPARGVLLFLALAPLLPVAGVAAAFGWGSDPVYEIGLTAPFSTFRLVLLRTAAIVTVCTAMSAVACLLLPDLGWATVGWLLPALALSVSTLAAGRWFDLVHAATAIAVAWVVVVVVLTGGGQDLRVVFGAQAQVFYAVVLVLAAAVVARNRGRFTMSGRTA